jgi:hypothetical protein
VNSEARSGDFSGEVRRKIRSLFEGVPESLISLGNPDEFIALERSSILGEATEQDKRDEGLVAQASACGFDGSKR